MTVENVKRRRSSETQQESLDIIESKFNLLMETLSNLKFVSAEAGCEMDAKCSRLRLELEKSKKELEELKSELNDKNMRESLHITQIQESRFNSEMEILLNDNIRIPEAKLRLFWQHLMLRVEPARTGGVQVTLGFPHELRLPDLKFILQFSQDNQYAVSDCDPMIIGMSELVSQLNNDNKGGALARFCCRIRARYTAQYSTEFS